MEKFIYLIENKQNLIRLVFNILDDDRNMSLSITELIRKYVNLPKTSEFAEELRSIFAYYLDNYVRPSP